MTKELYAKSNGLSLKTHSEVVSEACKLIANKMANNDIIDRYGDTIRCSAMLHDIGKLTTNFQEFLKGNKKTPNLKFRHNEIGWAFVSKYLSDDFKNKGIILNTIYWHHGISNKVSTHTDTEILNSLDNDSIKNMLEYLTDIVGAENITEDLEYLDSVVSPLFYPPNTNSLPHLILCRSIVITADRIASNFILVDEVNEGLVDKYFNLKNEIKIGVTKFDGTARFEQQKSIVELTEKTTFVNATAGFGKTITGLMWGLKHKQKILWVTPRNTVAMSAYHSAIEEFKNLNINPSIQLILSGEIVNTNSPNDDMYECDIIITNIDNFLGPSFKNNIMDASSLLFGASVVFDEYHELISDAPFMSLFVNIMRVRHRLTSSNTLLLSATPTECEFLWDAATLTTKTLPSKNTHYPAIHNKKYKVNVLTNRPKVLPNTSSLVIRNTVSSAQNEKRDGDYSLLLHNEFITEKKDADFIKLLNDYGKKSPVSPNKANVVGTHIIQASLDISFNHLYEDVLSPQSTMQRIGRCDRFGNCEGQPSINVIKELPVNNVRNSQIQGEITIKNILYSRNLSDAWFDFLVPYNGQELTLDELYDVYNKFTTQYSTQIKQFVKSKFDESNAFLTDIYPVKIETKKGKEGVFTAGSNKLRSVNSEIFYIVQHENGVDWVGPFTKQILRDFDVEFRERDNISGRMFKTMEKLRDANDDRFEYNDIIDNKKYQTIDGIRRMGKKSNTPYIVYDRYYNDELGIIKKINLDN